MPKKKAPEAPASEQEAKEAAAAETKPAAPPEREKEAVEVPVTLEVAKGFSLRSVGGKYAVWEEARNIRISPPSEDRFEAERLFRGFTR